jgi:hypothetical protein
MIWMGRIWNTTSAMEWKCDSMTSEGGVFSTKGRASMAAMSGKRYQVFIHHLCIKLAFGVKRRHGGYPKGHYTCHHELEDLNIGLAL